eukprot:687322-Rhodomonas_salina.2
MEAGNAKAAERARACRICRIGDTQSRVRGVRCQSGRNAVRGAMHPDAMQCLGDRVWMMFEDGVWMQSRMFSSVECRCKAVCLRMQCGCSAVTLRVEFRHSMFEGGGPRHNVGGCSMFEGGVPASACTALTRAASTDTDAACPRLLSEPASERGMGTAREGQTGRQGRRGGGSGIGRRGERRRRESERDGGRQRDRERTRAREEGGERNGVERARENGRSDLDEHVYGVGALCELRPHCQVQARCQHRTSHRKRVSTHIC